MAEPANYSAESMLPSPSQAVELKVFQGGGGMPDGAQPQVSLYDQPSHPVNMTVYKGGGKPALDEAAILSLTFRGIPLSTLLTEEKYTFLSANNFLVFYPVSELSDSAYDVKIGKTSIFVVPIVLLGEKVKTGNGSPTLLDKYFYADSTLVSEATADHWTQKLKENKPFVFPFSTLLTPSDTTLFGGGAAAAKTGEGAAKTGEGAAAEKTGAEVKQEPTSGPVIVLQNKMVVRFVQKGSKIAKDIQELRFLPSEQYIFDNILHFNTPFIRKYLKEYPEEWLTFWMLFIHNDVASEGMNGTSSFFYLSSKDAEKVKSFFQSVHDAYDSYLITKAKRLLFKTQAYGTEELYEMIKERTEKGLDSSIFIEIEKPKGEVQEDKNKEADQLDHTWKSIRTMFKLAEAKVQEYKINVESIENVVDKIREQKQELESTLATAREEEAAESILRDSEQQLKVVNRQYIEQLKRLKEALFIYEKAYKRLANISTTYVLYEEAIPFVLKIKKGLLSEEDTTAFNDIKDKVGKSDFSETDIKNFQKQLDIQVKTIDLLGKTPLESTAPSEPVVGSTLSLKNPRKKAVYEEDEEDEFDEDEEELEDLLEEVEELTKGKGRPKKSGGLSAKPKKPSKKKQVEQEKKEKEADNLLTTALDFFLDSKSTKKVLTSTTLPGSINTKFLFFFLLWSKLKKYLEDDDKEIIIENISMIPGSENKINNIDSFINYIKNSKDERSIYEKTTEAILLLEYKKEGIFNLSKEEINKIVKNLLEYFDSIEFDDVTYTNDDESKSKNENSNLHTLRNYFYEY